MRVAQRLGHGQRVAVVQPRPAIGLRLGQPQQAKVSQAFEDFMRRVDFLFFPLLDMGVDFFVDEALQRFLDFEVFVGVVHAVSCSQSWF